MNEDDYLSDRLDNQIKWYSQKSQTNQKFFKLFKIIEVIAAAGVPFWAGIGVELPYYAIIIGTLGLLVTISVIYNFQENWIKYRTTSESLKHEKHLYKTKCYPYNSEDRFFCLVQRIEGLVSKENSQWSRDIEKL